MCLCGNRSATVICSENEKEHQRIRTSQLASKMPDIASGNSVDLKDIFSPATRTEEGILKTNLECNENCSRIERNRRLALALQIENPELTTKAAPPKYSEILKEMAKKDPHFVRKVQIWLPTISVVDVVQGVRKAPGPTPAATSKS